MALVMGIDEAGYGPILGPLVVSSASAWVEDDKLAQANWWEVLRASCTRKCVASDRRLAVADSKKLHRSKGGLGALERAVRVMLAVSGAHPDSWRAWLRDVAPDAVGDLEAYPWYAKRDFALPLAESGDVRLCANAVKRDLHDHKITMRPLHVSPLPEGHYNQLADKTGNKAVVLLGRVLTLIDKAMRASEDHALHVSVDRLGGRTHYREALNTAWPQFELAILEEGDQRSAYRLSSARRTVTIEFVTGGDDARFLVALASCASKYTRELYMHAFNAFWCGHKPDLKPTAGYYTDAQRWLADIDGVRSDLAIDRRMLVRQR